MRGGGDIMNLLKDLWIEEDAVGVVEIILILVVLIGLVIIFKRHKAECKANQYACQEKTRGNAQFFHGLEPKVNERIVGISCQSENGNDEQGDFDGFHQPRSFKDIGDSGEESVFFVAPQQDQRSRTQQACDNSQTRFVCNQNIQIRHIHVFKAEHMF